jgi:hypothetical protein
MMIFFVALAILLLGINSANAQQDLVDTVANGCKTELEKYCNQVTPGQGRVLACLYAYGDKLSSKCEYPRAILNLLSTHANPEKRRMKRSLHILFIGILFSTVALTAADKTAMAAGIKQAEPVIKAKIETLAPRVKGKLAAGAQRADLYRAAYVLAEGIGARWQLAATWYPGCEVIVQISTSAVLSCD